MKKGGGSNRPSPGQVDVREHPPRELGVDGEEGLEEAARLPEDGPVVRRLERAGVGAGGAARAAPLLGLGGGGDAVRLVFERLEFQEFEERADARGSRVRRDEGLVRYDVDPRAVERREEPRELRRVQRLGEDVLVQRADLVVRGERVVESTPAAKRLAGLPRVEPA